MLGRMIRAAVKNRVVFALLLPSLWSAAACTSARGSEATHPGGYETLELRVEGFSRTVTPAELAEDLGYLAPLELKYVGNSISGPANIQNVVTGDIDVGGAFNGAIVKLMAAKAPITALFGYYGTNESTWAGFFVLNDSPIRTAKDLIGKKIAMNTLGAHHEFMLKEYLFRNGFTPEQVRQVTMVVVPPVNGEQVLRQRQVEVSVLSGILRDKALERGGIRPLFSDHELFGAFTAGSMVMRNDFIAKNPKTVRKFVQGTARALEWARSTPRAEVVARFEQQKTLDKEDPTTVTAAESAIDQASQILSSMDDVLKKMMDLEDFNELLDIVRSLIDDQEKLMNEAKKEQKKAVLDLLK